MNQFINVVAVDPNGDEFTMSVEVAQEKCTECIKTIINRACLVVDAYGYGDYDAMYDYRMDILDNPVIEAGFSGCIYTLDMNVTDSPNYEVCTDLDKWDTWMLAYYEYDKDCDPYDLSVQVPKLGAERFVYSRDMSDEAYLAR